MVRFHLPPNLAAAAVRDAIPLRVEIDLARAPAAEEIPVLALLQRWCGGGEPPKFIQLSRSQVRELAAAAGSQPMFIEGGTATSWRHAQVVAEPKPLVSESPTFSRATPAKPRASSATPLLVDGSEHFLAITLPSREDPRYTAALTLLKETGFVLEPSNRKWWLRDRHKTLNFLATHGTRLRESLGAEFSPNFERNTAHLRTAEVATTIAPAGDDFSVTLALQAGGADESTLRTAVATNRGYLEADGKIFLLDAAKIARLTTAQRTLSGDPTATLAPRRTQRISAARAAEAQDVLEELSPDFQPPETWKERSTALRNLSALEPAPLPGSFDQQLRPYQRLGVAWLWHLFRHQLGGILADEMGLGKTLQALGLLSAVQRSRGGTGRASAPSSSTPPPVSTSAIPPSSLRRRPAAKSSATESGPEGQGGSAATTALQPQGAAARLTGDASLVVCPASLLENWRREAARFTPELRVFVHHGDQRLADAREIAGFDVIITSYGTLTRDQTLFTDVEFACVLADEAQHIKNRRSQNAAALRALRARARFLLTGTPLENSLEDLRSLFEFLLPGYLTKVPAGIRADERAWFDDRLRAQTARYILRRTKAAVAPELPAKLEQVLWCELTPPQAKLYRDLQETSERELFDLEASGANEARLKFAALTQLLRLRQVCCDPRLVAPDAPAAHSAKLEAFSELLAEAVDDGHRVLVFSQFTSLLGLLRTELDTQQLGHCYLDGSMPARARQAEVDRFQQHSDIPLFLLSLKAGGTGLNLTGADTVVHFDPWWNPAAEAQATDRAHRIGQSRVVTSYKLIAAGTVEEKVLALQAEKRALLAGVFEASDAAAAQLTLADLKSLLK